MSTQSPAPIFSPVETEASEPEYVSNGCCFWVPCLPSRSSSTVWERISTSGGGGENNKEEREGIFTKGVDSLKKVREWSELVAGPKWKTFIRRFNKNRCKAGKFQYDPLSYAMNFDDCPAQNCTQLEDDRFTRGFSARYAALAASTKSMDSPALPPLI